MITTTVSDDVEAAARACAQRVADAIERARAARGVAHVSLAGGRTPARAYELLAEQVGDWRDVHLWFGDERCVPLEDPDSNHLLVVQTLLAKPLDPPPVLHPVADAAEDPAAAAAAYERVMRDQVPAESPRGPASAGHVAGSGTPSGAVPVLDVALLGLGEDGHTASLFPGDEASLNERERLCISVHGTKPPFERITLTFPALTAARQVLVLANGTGKAWAVGAMLAGPNPQVPASMLADASTELIVDRAAAPA